MSVIEREIFGQSIVARKMLSINKTSSLSLIIVITYQQPFQGHGEE